MQTSGTISLIGLGVFGLLLAGHYAEHFLPLPAPKIVGIDLGTTFSCIGLYYSLNGSADVVRDEQGNQCIPSVVTFLENGSVAVGFDALALAELLPSRTVYDAKRFIGRVFSREAFIAESAPYVFNATLAANGSAVFHAPPFQRVSPEHVGQFIVRRLKGAAERRIGRPVSRAVIAVPADFDARQREHTRFAAELAGLQVVRMISEPTAAALAYGLHRRHGDLELVLVLDLGGGTLDVSLLRVQGGLFATQALAGNNHLGGEDFNQRLVAHLQQLAVQSGCDRLTVTRHPRDRQALALAAERLKRALSDSPRQTLRVKLSSCEFTSTVSREEFELLIADLVERVLEPVEAVLAATGTTREEVDEVLLVGGSTRLPCVRRAVERFFGRAPLTAVEPELAVALGVAVQAGILGGMWPLTVSATELPPRVGKIRLR